MVKVCGDIRGYDKKDIVKLKKIMCRIEKMKFYVCGTKNKCLLLRKNKNRMTSLCQNRFSNPVYSKYKNDSNRKEPFTLLAYQIIFIIKRGCIPKHPLNLSHKCGRRH